MIMRALRAYYNYEQARSKSLGEITEQIAALKAEIVTQRDNRLSALATADEKAIEAADKAIAVAERKLEIAEFQQKQKMSHSPDEAAKMASEINSEAVSKFEALRKQDDELRSKIAEAKRVYLESVAEHHALVSEGRRLRIEINDALNPLQAPLKTESLRLRDEAQAVERRAVNVPKTGAGYDTAAVEAIYEQKRELMGRAIKLDVQTREVDDPLQSIGKPYLIHDTEQRDALRGHVSDKPVEVAESAFGADMRARAAAGM